VHTHTAKAGLLGRLAGRLAGVPLVVHTYHGHVLHGYYGPVKSCVLRRMEQALARLSDRLVTVSEQIKTELITYGVGGVERINVIPLGFDLEPFLNAHTGRGEFRHELGLDKNIRLIGIVGRIFPIKNHRLFLNAAAQIAKKDPSARFVIVGDGVLRSALEQQVRDLRITERVLFTGWRRDLARIYADLDVLVVSSDNEGTPVSAIEAMTSGCPVVATRVVGLPDLIADHETGMLVPPRDAGALATGVLRILHDPETAQKISQNARMTAQRRFGVQRLISEVDHLYMRLLEEKAVSFPSTESVQARAR
jgi:glycosyltransferase involved in cell wall biosynthesis